MKKYMICLLLFVSVSAACLTAGYVITRNYEKEEAEGIPATELESETVVEDRIAANQNQVMHEPAVEKVTEEYYLVSENGFLLVFLKDKTTIYLYTHIPVMDFPEKERAKLMEGVGFGSMMEVFNYLESYTS